MKHLVAMGLVVVVSTLGCSGGEGPQGVDCWISSLTADEVVSGQVDVVVGFEGPVARLDLLVGGEVVLGVDVAEGAGTATLGWDTAATTDGGASVSVRASSSGGATADAPAVSVVVDNSAPVASLDIPRFSVLQGRVDVPFAVDEANLTGIRLLSGDEELMTADSATTSYSWDTTAAEVGVHRLALEVTDAAGHVTTTEVVPVVVANGGEEIEIQYSPSAWIIIPDPFDPTAEVHTQVVAPMTSRPVERVISWLTWDATDGWLLEYTIGQGICPHRGVAYVDDESRDGEVVLDLRWTDLDEATQQRSLAFAPDHPEGATTFPYNADPATCGSFFGHVADMEPADHAGMELSIEAHFVFIYAE